MLLVIAFNQNLGPQVVFRIFCKHYVCSPLWIHQTLRRAIIEQSLGHIQGGLIILNKLRFLLLLISFIGNKCVRVTAIESISVLIGLLPFFFLLLCLGLRVDHCVAAPLLEPHALLLTHEEAQRCVKVAPRLYHLDDICLARHALSC